MTLIIISSALHALAGVVWVGGMFFAHMALRPSVGPLEPPQRLALMNRILGRFFTWVWLAVVLLPATGYILVANSGGFDSVGIHVHIMLGIGWLMIALFIFLYAVPFRHMRAALAAEEWAEAGKQLAVIRHIVAVNLAFGLITAAVGASGRFWT